MWAIERFGRRKPLLFGGIWQVVWLLVFGSVGSQYDPSTNKAVGGILILATCMFIVGFASTWGPGVWVATGEMFPLRVRAHSASFATAGNWGWNFLLTFFTPFITSSIGYKLGYVFAGTNLLGVLVVFFFYYESSSLSLEQVDVMYNDPDCRPWTSGSKYTYLHIYTPTPRLTLELSFFRSILLPKKHTNPSLSYRMGPSWKLYSSRSRASYFRERRHPQRRDSPKFRTLINK